MIKLKDILEVSDYYKKQISRRKKFQRAYGESKTNGGKTVNEISREYGDLNQATCGEIFRNEFIHKGTPDLSMDILDEYGSNGIVFEDEKINKAFEKLDGKSMTASLKNKILRMLKDKGCKVIHTDGDIRILKHTFETSYTYHMFDFGANVKMKRGLTMNRDLTIDPTFYVGRIYTEDEGDVLKYSPSKQLNFKNVEQVHLSEIGVEYRGLGYGSYMYDVIAKNVDALYSDSTLYAGSFKLWTKHMSKKANFFGALISSQDFILPVYEDIDSLASKNSDIVEDINGFVAIFKKVPPKLNELKEFLDGVNPDEIIWAYDDMIERIPVNGIRDRIEKADSFKEFHKSLYGYEPDSDGLAGAYIVFHPQVTFVIKEVSDGLDYMLI